MDGFVVKNDMHNFNKMAEYILFYTFDNSYKLEQVRKQLNVSQLTISQEIKSKTGGLTGWYSNLETGKNMPTRETIKPIEKHLNLCYEDIVPKFNNMKTHHSVWNYDMAKRCSVHVTPKPVDLLKNIKGHKEDIIICEFCDKKIGGVSNFKKHMRISHNIDVGLKKEVE
jgi:site-specific DNA-methyltransferase (adenine-specific)